MTPSERNFAGRFMRRQHNNSYATPPLGLVAWGRAPRRALAAYETAQTKARPQAGAVVYACMRPNRARVMRILDGGRK